MPESELASLLDIELLENHIQNKVIKRQSHPTLPICILNYTQKCAHENLWDSVTMRCRGLIYNCESGELVAVPFAKFFNYDTGDREETYPENLPTFEPEITKKLDGSLGILWRYKDEWGIATRGSFTSDQAKWATKWLKDNNIKVHNFSKGITPLFEIIYPENQVVVKYESEGLTLLGCIDNETGQEIKHDVLVKVGKALHIPVVEKLNGESIEDLLDKDPENEEGYVATWHHEEGPPLKVKIKFATYFRLHRLLTGTSPKRIWEYLKDGIPLDELAKDVPEHFNEWISWWVSKLTDKYKLTESISRMMFDNKPHFLTRKEFALWVKESGDRNKLAAIMFKMYDNQPYSDIIWKMVKPLTENIGTFRSVDE